MVSTREMRESDVRLPDCQSSHLPVLIMNCSGLYRYQRRSRDLQVRTKDDMRQRDQGSIARRRQHEEYSETQGIDRRSFSWVTESLPMGSGVMIRFLAKTPRER